MIDQVFAGIGSTFLAAVLVNTDNQVIATHVVPGLDKPTANAPVETTRRIIQNPDSRAALENLHESVFFDLDGRRLVCRPLQLNGEMHLLIVLTPAQKAYRRALNNLVRQIVEAALK